MGRGTAAAVAAILGAAPIAAQAPRGTGTILGVVIDHASGGRLAGAAVGVTGTLLGATTDSTGRFTIAGLDAGDVRLRVRLFGYAELDTVLVVAPGTTTRVELRLHQQAAMLGAVRSRARPPERDAFESRPNVGSVQLSTGATSGVPSVGEPDVMRVVQLLPGAEARNDYSTGLNVWGGESDQNLILMDGYPIYNPFHFGGLFSTFIDPMVGDVQLTAGGFPATYGGRLSSVLNVGTADDARPGLHGTEELSLVAATGDVSDTFAGGRGSWSVAGRRTYADEFVSLISSDNFPYHFRDEQAHMSYAFTPSTRLTVTAYDGRDVLDANIAALGDSANSTAGGGDLLFDWGNTVAGATLSTTSVNPRRSRLLHWLLGDSTTLEQRAYWSRFSTSLNVGSGSLQLGNSVSEVGATGRLSAHTAAHDLSYGYELASYGVRYNTGSPQTGSNLFSLAQNPSSGALYYDDLWRPSHRWLVEDGAREETVTGTGWSGLSPRVSAKFFVDSNFALTAAVGRFAQWMHSLDREDIPVRLFDFWVASDRDKPVSTAWQYVAGAEHWLSDTRFVRVEGFYKKYSNLLESNPAADPEVPSTAFFTVQGESYGGDVLLRQVERGPLSGWISYTYVVATRDIDGFIYFPGHDRRHDLNVVGTWRTGKYVLGARFGLATGTPYTPIVGQIQRWFYDPIGGSFVTSQANEDVEFIGGTRNGARLPTTQRLDLDARRAYKWRGMDVVPYVSIVNAYDAKNVFIYVFDYQKSPPVRSAISQFPFLPSAGVSLAF